MTRASPSDRASQATELESTLREIGYLVLLWNRVDVYWDSFMGTLLPACRSDVVDALARSWDTARERRDVVLDVARAQWSAGSTTMKELLRLKAETDRAAEFRDGMLGAINVGVTTDIGGRPHLCFTRGAKTRPDRDSVDRSLSVAQPTLRTLVRDLEVFAQTLMPAGTAPTAGPALMEDVDKWLGRDPLTHEDA